VDGLKELNQKKWMSFYRNIMAVRLISKEKFHRETFLFTKMHRLKLLY